MSELITLSKSSPEFEAYLLGTFSSKKRALPIQTLNVNSAAEAVTFRVVSVKSIQKPSALLVFLKTIKARSILFILVPLLLILTKNRVDFVVVDLGVLLLTVFGSILAFFAAGLRNDYIDHMKGIDRVIETGGSRAIQNGWVTASQVKFSSGILLGLAILCALPLIFIVPSLGFVILASLVVGLWAQFKKRNSFKYQIGGELSLFLMLGPFFAVGVQMALAGKFDKQSLWLGCLWGWTALFVVHLRNVANILPSAQAGFTNTVNWLGFDQSRRLLAVWWVLLVIFNGIYHWEYSEATLAAGTTLILSLGSIHFVWQLKNLASPIGSELRNVFRSGFYLFLLVIGLWVLECLWFLLR